MVAPGSFRPDGYFSDLGLRRLVQGEFEDAVLNDRLDPVAIHLVRDREGALIVADIILGIKEASSLSAPEVSLFL